MIIKKFFLLNLNLLFVVLIIFKAETALADLSVKEKKKNFVESFAPIITEINKDICNNRNILKKINNNVQNNKNLSRKEKRWIKKQFIYYGLLSDNQDLSIDEINSKLPELSLRMDVIPGSMVLAQGATESAWGTSRFAKEGYNYFGQWCYTPGCGIVPKARPKGKNYEVQKFADLKASMQAYFKNLNTHANYQEFRQLRVKERAAGTPITGDEMVKTLNSYAEIGDKYPKQLSQMMKDNDWAVYDKSPYCPCCEGAM